MTLDLTVIELKGKTYASPFAIRDALNKYLITYYGTKSISSDRNIVFDTANVAGFIYDIEQGIFISKIEPLQRNAGYFNLYDAAAPGMGMIINCEPILFTYGKNSDGSDKHWKIELWKGQYGIATGAEIGVYTGEFEVNSGVPVIDHKINTVNFGPNTACASNNDLLQMSFTLRDKSGDEIFHRQGKHWWLTGFDPGVISKPADLKMDIAITFKDAKMRDAFVSGLEDAGYKTKDDQYGKAEVMQKGNTVSFTFDKPHTKQPYFW